MPRATAPISLTVDRALLAAYRAALAAPLPPPTLVLALDGALRSALAAHGYPVPAPLLPATTSDGRRTRQKKDAAPA